MSDFGEIDPGVWPTPEEFVKFWDTLSDDRKLAKAAFLIDALTHYRNCPNGQVRRSDRRMGGTAASSTAAERNELNRLLLPDPVAPSS